MHHFLVKRSHGFTLVELMVALAVVGILAAVAYPAMTSHLQRSRRADATALLTAVVQAQERYRSNNGSYAADLGDNGLKIDDTKITPHYRLSLAGVGATPSFVSGYIATAEAKEGSPQRQDTDCRQLIVTLAGAQLDYSSKSSADQDTSTKCWPR
ncbi:type IV pilin protein [Roseateles sp.]|uniref:type IV pilin protein n=1 Tax=Roseateles sp. TaxID=1971397 RepID=UPI003BA8CAF1